MERILDILEYIRAGVTQNELLWAAYGIFAVLIIGRSVKRITDTDTIGEAVKHTLLYKVSFTLFSLFSLYMLTPDSIRQLFP